MHSARLVLQAWSRGLSQHGSFVSPDKCAPTHAQLLREKGCRVCTGEDMHVAVWEGQACSIRRCDSHRQPEPTYSAWQGVQQGLQV